MKKYLIASIALFTGFTLMASAQVTAQNAADGITTISGLITLFTGTVVRSIGVLFLSAGVVIFFLGIVQYIWGLRAGDAIKAKAGSNFMLWGLISLFVMFSVYGIITFGQRIFGIDGTSSIVIPEIRINGSGGGSPVSNPTGGSGTSGTSVTNPLGGGGTQGTPVYNTGTGQSCPVGQVASANGGCITSVGGGGRTTGGVSPYFGADCAVSSDCGGGLTCVSYICQ